MKGGTCDVTAFDERIALELAKIRATVVGKCQIGQLTELYFPGGVLDAQADLSITCRDQADEMIATIYAPEPATEDDAACVKATGKYARKVVRFVVRRKARTMDRMADRVFEGAEKLAFMDRIAGHLDAGRARWVAGLLRGCPDFERVYGTSAESFVGFLKDRADCVLSATHGNDSLACPRICGNGIPEDGEECDDGNDNPADACANDCTLN